MKEKWVDPNQEQMVLKEPSGNLGSKKMSEVKNLMKTQNKL